MISYSIIIPVYNRPVEVRELLESLLHQTCKDFEVLIIEDGSAVRCDEVVKEYEDQLNVRYFFKPNSGRSLTRNYGMERAEGKYQVFFDSDCIIPGRLFREGYELSERDECGLLRRTGQGTCLFFPDAESY